MKTIKSIWNPSNLLEMDSNHNPNLTKNKVVAKSLKVCLFAGVIHKAGNNE